MAEGESMRWTMGVWWDLYTCPVPADIDPGIVRPCIESALKKYYGREVRVTVFAVGNLEYISPQLLKAISSSGIVLRHTPFRGSSLNSCLFIWKKYSPPPRDVLLISGDSWWFHSIFNQGYTFLRAFPESLRPSLPAYLPAYNKSATATDDKGQEWDWETLLKENSSGVKPARECSVIIRFLHIFPERYRVDEPAGFCDVCDIPSRNCQDFIRHLKSTEHRNELASWKDINPNRKFPKCELCQYTGYDDHNMAFHYKSDEHKQNLTSWKDTNPTLEFPICKLCHYVAYDFHNMAFHLDSDEHKQNVFKQKRAAQNLLEASVEKLINMTKQHWVVPVSIITVSIAEIKKS